MKHNVILIGPPGVGKSTIGVLLAKELSMPFVDTDIVIQAVEGRRLQDILDVDGIEAFRRIEESHILKLDVDRHVIATGGSVVYSDPAMSHLKRSGVIVFLDLPCEKLLQRIENLDSRGVVMPAHMTFCDLYDERLPLYKRYADAIIDCTNLTHEQVVKRVVSYLDSTGLQNSLSEHIGGTFL